MTARNVLAGIAVAFGAMGVVLGLVPIHTYEIGDSFGDDSVYCGNAWAPNDDDLTSTGQAACAAAGLNVNRSLSFALLAGAVVLLIAGAMVGSPGQLTRETETEIGTEPDSSGTS